MLDLSAAFDMINHKIHLKRLERIIGTTLGSFNHSGLSQSHI